jgi:hypothetical protein
MTNYKNISRIIRLVYALLLALVVTVAVVAEYNVLPVEGSLMNLFDAKTMYIIEVGMLFLVGACMLLSLKSFDRVLKNKMSTIGEEGKPKAYVGIYCVRLSLLAIPMLMGMYFYYGLLENWGLYYALASFVASLFCLPSAEGVEIEMASNK